MSVTVISSADPDLLQRPSDSRTCRPTSQPIDDRLAAIRRLSLFADVSEDALADLASHTRWQRNAPNEVVVDVGDDTNDVFVITEGIVRVVVRTAFGYESIFDDLRAGDFFGEVAAIDSASRSANVTALTQTRLCVIPGAAFMSLVLSTPDVAHRLMRVLSGRLRNKDERLIEFGALTVRQRLIAELLRLSRKRDSGGRIISPPPVQHVLASRVGTRRETVSREIAQMTRSGALTIGRGGYILHHPERLRAEIQARLQGPADTAVRTKAGKP